MNLRVVILLIIVVGFAVGCGAFSFLSGGGITLEQAYDSNQVNIIQNTAAGTIPHNVTIKNNGTKPVVVEKGTLLNSKESQDLVIVDDKKISPNANDTVRAYCVEPDEKAVPGKSLTPSGMASSQIRQIVDSSDLSDVQNATKSQLQIWVIVGKGEVDSYTGEASAVVKKQGLKNYQFQGNLSSAKNDVMARFNLTSEGIKNLSGITESSNSASTFFTDIRQWIRNIFGI